MTLTDIGRRWLKEPLVHFLIAGALVFGLMSGRAPDLGERRIVVDEGVVSGLAQRFVESFRRPPTPDEIDGMINDYVRDQVYYREALALGLDRNDDVVIKRLRRKMEALAVAEAEARAPGDDDLQALLDKDPAHYAIDPRFTFDQVYLGSDTPAGRLEASAKLAALRKGAAVSGAAAPIPARLDDVTASDIAARFGEDFAGSLRDLPDGVWSGPVASGLGLHLVRIAGRRAPDRPNLDSVRQRLANDWRAATIRKAQDDAYAQILKGYDVAIARPKE